MVDIYTNETCPYCKQIKEELTKNNIEFNERLTKDWPAKWQELISLTGMANLPTIVHENNIYTPGRDFNNPQHLINLINTKHHGYDINKEILTPKCEYLCVIFPKNTGFDIDKFVSSFTSRIID